MDGNSQGAGTTEQWMFHHGARETRHIFTLSYYNALVNLEKQVLLPLV